MKLKSIKIKNFRSYKDEIEIEFNDLTAIVGKNDIGKSSILEAMDLFFNDNKGIVKLELGDFPVNSDDLDVVIIAKLIEMPETIILDSNVETSFEEEYLLNCSGELEVKKIFGKGSSTPKVYITASHPTNDICKDIITKKQADLKKIIETNEWDCDDLTKNSIMRKCIWDNCIPLDFVLIDIDLNKAGEAKDLWMKLKNYLPMYALFQADRKNSDDDSEVQDPLKIAVKEILQEQSIKSKLDEIATEIKLKLSEVSTRTFEKLNEMAPDIANRLEPIIPETESLKWADVFKSVSIVCDDSIPINKRGSGVKRLVLLNFFRAEAERKQNQNISNSIIYAIEEPETSQHSDFQKKLICALKDLSNLDNTQVIITSHSPVVVKELDFDQIRIVKEENHVKSANIPINNTLRYPSLNEVNFIAFSEITEEYHNELYGFIDENSLLTEYKSSKPTRLYKQQRGDGTTFDTQKILSEYIRHQIHHPENRHNARFTNDELKDSIELMREFIINKRTSGEI